MMKILGLVYPGPIDGDLDKLTDMLETETN